MKDKPTAKQVAWVFTKINEAWDEKASFRYMIYEIMGFKAGDYGDLYMAGGMNISNKAHEKPEPDKL